MTWLADATRLRAQRVPAVLITQIGVRGHAPREAGVKMIATAEGEFGTIGGGNLEMTAVDRAREMLHDGVSVPETLTLRLNDKARTQHGRQCCGGEVVVVFEPLPVVPAVAIFGMGHVGLELARILSRQDVELYLTDSRPEQVAAAGRLEPGEATVHVHHSMLPEDLLAELPPGSHVLIMTHDHAEDFSLCDQALRTPGLGSVGLIGSSAKWTRFRAMLAESGHAADAIDSIQSPIGISTLAGKHPATIAVSVAADLLARFLAVQGERP
ncbi:xanthine dehydrogenase accessory protein XdhC [Tsukamurella sp. PLM1]|uniref:xanthine dehydrogenase accessory protein XdhC n=1 Tax=Tsukamurella sp. PLM1 TaxID=2929795 RepID=UPI0020578040|nr:xanthine dehydrogenase accessory protein XdhC [Tsukamurella sp. PLM1]BDH57325.1 xanthine dehydrogenase accessory protein XdhC [Tsukamurella sp. PLM1]